MTMHCTFTENWQRRCLAIAMCCVLVSGLLAGSSFAQLLGNPGKDDSADEVWQPPDITELPTDWWLQGETGSVETGRPRVERFMAGIEQRSKALDGDDLITAQNALSNLKSLFELLALAKEGPGDQQFVPPLASESYSLDDVLKLRAQWREMEGTRVRVNLEIEQSERQGRLLHQRRDKLLREYDATEQESPSRILIGIQRVVVRSEIELISTRMQNFQQTLKQISEQSLLISEQLEFAQDHLISDDVSTDELEKTAAVAHARVTSTSEKVAALQAQLLNALSADPVNTSLELLRKQQLTRGSAEAQLAHLQDMLATSKLDWYRFRNGLVDFRFDIQSTKNEARRLIDDSLKQAEIWSSISQSTLIIPPPDNVPNTVKNVQIAQSVARDTLAFADQIKSTSDDLVLIQAILTKDLISAQSGLGNTGTRLSLAFASAVESAHTLADYHLFSIGDTPVTPAGIVKMLMIMAIAIGISWLIRFFLARGLRKKRAPQSPAFYALGRILHYIIVTAGAVAALGSIGIDFTSFALIAGALSVGIGFGLQAIVSNFVSGLILLFEGTLRVGDFIEVDGEFRGIVKEINTRATVINTNDGVDLVVPNSVMVTTQLTNWTLRESYGRLRVPFGVAYGSEKELVKKLALEAVGKVESALTHMPGLEPQVRLSGFGDSALEFTVLFWVSRQGVRRPGRTKANFLWEVETLLNENGVQIPFPQRDLHVKSDFRALETPEPQSEPEISRD